MIKKFMIIFSLILILIPSVLSLANFSISIDSDKDGASDNGDLITGQDFNIIVATVVDSSTPIKNVIFDLISDPSITFSTAVAGGNFLSFSQYLSGSNWHYSASNSNDVSGDLVLTTITANGVVGDYTLSFNQDTLSAKKGFITVDAISAPKTITIQEGGCTPGCSQEETHCVDVSFADSCGGITCTGTLQPNCVDSSTVTGPQSAVLLAIDNDASLIEIATQLKVFFASILDDEGFYEVINEEKAELLTAVANILNDPNKSKLQKVSLVAYELMMNEDEQS